MWIQFVVYLMVVIGTFADIKHPKLNRSLKKHGFHRDLETVLSLPVTVLPDVATGGRHVECFLLFTETIPSGAYVDPYQLNSLRPYGGPDTVILGVVDIEKPEFAATELTVLVYGNLSWSGEDTLQSGYTLPVHLRYHAVAHGNNYATVRFTHPEIAIRCSNLKLGMIHSGYHGNTVKQKTQWCDSSSKVLCDWTMIHYETVDSDVSLTVPVGEEDQESFVAIVTIVTTLGACLTLVLKTLSVQPKIKTC